MMGAPPLPRPCRLTDGRPKIRYETRAEAKRMARAHGIGEWLYRCPHCGYFHLATHDSGKRPRRRKGRR